MNSPLELREVRLRGLHRRGSSRAPEFRHMPMFCVPRVSDPIR